MKKLAFIATSPLSVEAFLKPHILVLSARFDITVVTNTQGKQLVGVSDHAKLISVNLVRKVSIIRDLLALVALVGYLKNQRFDAVHTITPKAGLLGMLAAWFCGVSVRTHTFTGQVWVNKKGFVRWVYKHADLLITWLATDILVDSFSQREFLINEGVVTEECSQVLGAGSICGVNLDRFHADLRIRDLVRQEFGVSASALVILFVGRLVRDKGIFELAMAFKEVASQNKSVVLFLVGPDEDEITEELKVIMANVMDRVHFPGATSEPERYMKAADLFCLPSYREGFGSSVIEAAACGVPALVSNIYGLCDAVNGGVTGWMVEKGNVRDLTIRLELILGSRDELRSRGALARQYVCNFFAETLITKKMVEYYRKKIDLTYEK